ncbi:MAG: ASCH domain-containing protein [Candidatus Bathyarchaeota archaeon]|nr:ASCH domain-containing protein [Candidatus Bathyarchaeota archaeon]
MTLLFKRQFINKIRSGAKTQTRRLKQPRLKIGKKYNLRENYRTTLPDKIFIVDIYQQYLGDITLDEVKREGFKTKTEFINIWTEIYGEYDPEMYIWVVEFQYIDPTETFKEKP